MPPPRLPWKTSVLVVYRRRDEAAILNVRPVSRDRLGRGGRQEAGVAGATQPEDGEDNQRKPGQRQLATHETQFTSTTRKLPQDQGQRKDRKGKVPNHHFHNLRRNTRGPRRTRFWGGRGLGREDRECKDGHRKAERRRSGRAGGGAGGPKTGAGRPKEGRAAGRKRPGSRVGMVFCPGHGPPAPARRSFWPGPPVAPASGFRPRRPAGARRPFFLPKRPPAP